MPGPVELVIFDCDGVLVDSEPIAVRVDLVVLAQFGLELSETEVIERFVGRERKRDLRGVRRVLDRDGDAGVDLVALDSERGYGAAAYVWLCAEDRRDGAELDDG